MSYDEMLEKSRACKSIRSRPSDEEHRLQRACVRWFNLEYPHLRGRLFAVPNGGRRDAVTGAKLKEEGVVSGVADLILLKRNSRYGALLIEMKRPGGYQSSGQRLWQETVTEDDEYRYVVCRSFDEFTRVVKEYLGTE